jgi:hypothetical protein
MKPFTKIATCVLLVIASIVSTGCAGTPVPLGSTPDIPHDSSKGRSVSGSASGFQLLLFIPIQVNSRHKRAYDELLAQANGDYVTDVRVKESWTYALVGTIYTVHMDAMAYARK